MDTSNAQGTAPFENHHRSSSQASESPTEPVRPLGKPARWAPWWLYLLVLLGANHLRASLLPVGTVPEPVVVLIALCQAAVLFVLVTATWRLTHRPRR